MRQRKDSKTKKKRIRGRDDPKDKEETTQPVFFMQEKSH